MSLATLIAQRMLSGRQPVATAKAAPKPPRDTPLTPGTRTTARVGVGTPPAVTLRSAPSYVPPRTEPDLAEAYRALPGVWGPAETPPLPPPVLRPGFRGSCKAIDAATGRTCKLPAHPGDVHSSERGRFTRCAAPGTTTFPLRQALDSAALTQDPGALGEMGRKTDAQYQRETRARKSAHAGDSTSTGIKSLDTNPNQTTEAA